MILVKKLCSTARRRLAGVVVGMLIMAGSMTGAAQDAAPGQPACTLSPVTLPLFDATPASVIAATPAAAQGAADAGAIEAALETIVTCINSPDPALRYAVFTDRYLAERLADGAVYQPAFERQLDTGASAADSRFALEAIEDVVTEDDGRVGVTVTLTTEGQAFTDRLVLAYVDGDWLIDEVELIEPAAGRGASTW
jgi:hypothetical protein